MDPFWEMVSVNMNLFRQITSNQVWQRFSRSGYFYPDEYSAILNCNTYWTLCISGGI